jgi:hypothetical protein
MDVDVCARARMYSTVPSRNPPLSILSPKLQGAFRQVIEISCGRSMQSTSDMHDPSSDRVNQKSCVGKEKIVNISST